MIECLLCVRHLTRLEGKNDAVRDRAPEGPVRKQVKGCSEQSRGVHPGPSGARSLWSEQKEPDRLVQRPWAFSVGC